MRTDANQKRLRGQGEPQFGGVAAQGVAKETGWSDTDDGDGLAIHDNDAAEQRGIGGEMCLPSTIIQHGCGSRAWLVIGRGKGAAQESIHAKKGEVVARDELGSKGVGNSVTASASNSHG